MNRFAVRGLLLGLFALAAAAPAALAQSQSPPAQAPAQPEAQPKAGAAPAKPPPAQPPKNQPLKAQSTPKTQADGILGKPVFDAKGQDMGLVTDVLVDHDGKPIAVVIDFGGFLGVGTRKIAIDWHLMQFHPNDAKTPVTLNVQKAQLQAAPEYKPGAPAQVLKAPPPAKPAQPAQPAPPAAQ